MKYKPGAYIMTLESYLNVDAISQSALKDISISPGYYKWKKNNFTPTRAMVLGSAIDTLVFDGEEIFNLEFAVADARTKNGKELLRHKRLLSKNENDLAIGTAKAIRKYRLANELIEEADSQLSLFCNYKCDLKARPDMIISGACMADLKTTSSLSNFRNTFYNLKYHWQAAFYIDMWHLLTGDVIGDFYFIVAEVKPPHFVEVFKVGADMIEIGRTEYNDALNTYIECLKNDEWPLNSGSVKMI